MVLLKNLLLPSVMALCQNFQPLAALSYHIRLPVLTHSWLGSVSAYFCQRPAAWRWCGLNNQNVQVCTNTSRSCFFLLIYSFLSKQKAAKAIIITKNFWRKQKNALAPNCLFADGRNLTVQKHLQNLNTVG